VVYSPSIGRGSDNEPRRPPIQAGGASTSYGWRVARPARLPPRAHSDNWPDDPCNEPTAEVARQVAIRLRTALNGRSHRTAAALTGVDHTTIGAVINGTNWPDVATLARLEAGLNIDLWPGRATSAGADAESRP